MSAKHQIREVAVEYFADQFREENNNDVYSMFEQVPTLIIEEENANMIRMLEIDEIRIAVFNPNGDSACGPDSFAGLFF